MKINYDKMMLAYDDVLLVPCYSEISLDSVSLHSQFTKNISLNIPIVSAAMDTVTEFRAAIVMAQEGGIGVIHKNMSPDLQAIEVEKVKKYESYIITSPITVVPEERILKVVEITKKHNITGVIVVSDKNKNTLVGILTSRDMKFEGDMNKRVSEIMTPRNRVITGDEKMSMQDARILLHKHRIEKLPLVDEMGVLKGLITMNDISKAIDYPNSNKDSLGRLRVAAAVGVGEGEGERVKKLISSKVDCIVVDTAHGHSKGVIDMIQKIKNMTDDVEVVAGNVVTKEACIDLIDAGADGIKVGIGPGSICTTRVISGVGVPQFSAVLQCVETCSHRGIPVIADGGIKYSGDIVKALAAGASCVMLGSLLAGTDESPGETIIYQGITYKAYRGMGSIGALQRGARDRYGQENVTNEKKFIPEGIEGRIAYRGSMSSTLFQLTGGIKSGMRYVGVKNFKELREKSIFISISGASFKEGHLHNVMITKEAPNYKL